MMLAKPTLNPLLVFITLSVVISPIFKIFRCKSMEWVPVKFKVNAFCSLSSSYSDYAVS
ncbi:hypothetical protein HCUR_00752 [Holospora curviuscula]|uniref:Uncharacterized protein n=1 Tax=Holospora curviuscula TaxID=1082868 RepID=A0A2S5R8W1_9PROT|nr:hypothetical protein HCUR_00752 [Holospora curviuscula]